MNHNDSRSRAKKTPDPITDVTNMVLYCVKSKSLPRQVKRCTTNGKKVMDISTWMFLVSFEWTSTTLETFSQGSVCKN